MERLREGFGAARIEDAKIPLYLTATDFFTGEQAVFSRGSVVDAVRASIAIPYIFQPWKIGDRTYVDGFLSDPMPIGVAIREGADVIITMGFESPYQTRISSVMRFAFQLSSITSNNLLKANYAFHNLAHHHEILPIIPQFQHKIHLFDTEQDPLRHRGGRARGREADPVSPAAPREPLRAPRDAPARTPSGRRRQRDQPGPARRAACSALGHEVETADARARRARDARPRSRSTSSSSTS